MDLPKALGPEENRALLARAQAGDKAARDSFIERNMRLVAIVLKRARIRRGSPGYEDYYQAGCLGLIRAVELFDISKGFKFSTYACHMILGGINNFRRRDNVFSFDIRDFGGKKAYAALNPINPVVVSEQGAETTIFDWIEDIGQSEERWIENMDLKGALDSLKENEKKIVTGLCKDETQCQIASALGVSQVHISRLNKKALKKMRDYMSA